MTTEAVEIQRAEYPGIIIEFDAEAHRYHVNGESWPSVTQIVNKHISKDGLKVWAEKLTIEGLCRIQEVNGHIPADPATAAAALYAEELTPDQQRDKAGMKGTVVHDALEAWHKHGEIPKPIDGHHAALARFLIDVRPVILSSEVLVASPRYRYTGKYDVRMHITEPTPARVQLTTDRENVETRMIPAGIYVGDAKSGKKLRQEHGLQLIGYEQASIECGMAPTRGRMAIHLRENGEYAVHLYANQRRDFTTLAEAFHRYKAANARKTKLNKGLRVPDLAVAA